MFYSTSDHIFESQCHYLGGTIFWLKRNIFRKEKLSQEQICLPVKNENSKANNEVNSHFKCVPAFIHACFNLNKEWKDKIIVLIFSYCQQTPWKDWNQQCVIWSLITSTAVSPFWRRKSFKAHRRLLFIPRVLPSVIFFLTMTTIIL